MKKIVLIALLVLASVTSAGVASLTPAHAQGQVLTWYSSARTGTLFTNWAPDNSGSYAPVACAGDILSENLSDVLGLLGSTSLNSDAQNWADTLAALSPGGTFGNIANYGYKPRGLSCTPGNTAGIAITSATAGNPIPGNAIIDTVDVVTSEPVISPAFIELPQANGYVQQAMNPAKPGKAVPVSYSKVSTANHVTFSVHQQIGGRFTIYWDYGKAVPFFCASAFCQTVVVFYPFISDITVTYELPTNTGTSTLEASWTPQGYPTAPAQYTQPPYAGTPLSFPTVTPTIGRTYAASPPSTWATNADACAADLFNPCGTLPWSVAALPTLNLPSPTAVQILPSPTPLMITTTPTPSGTPTPSATPGGATPTPGPSPTAIPISATPYSTPDIGQLPTVMALQFATLAPLGNPQLIVSGTPQGIGQLAVNLAGQIGQPLSLISALQGSNVNFGGWLTVVILIFILVIFTEILVLIFPAIVWLIRLILQIITALKPF